MKSDEIAICGLAAVRARFARDAGSIVRLYFDLPTSRKAGVMSRVLAASRRVYRCVEPSELEKISGTLHHGGIVAVVREAAPRTATAADVASWSRRRENAVVLDRVGNAHNLGAIARTAAYFGVPRLIVGGGPEAAVPGTAAYRVAEGGLEALEVVGTPDVPGLLRLMIQSGFDVVGAATRGGVQRPRGPAGCPWALVLGNEESGLSAEVERACGRLATIAGSGRVESLNVAAAGAILIRELSQ